MTNTESTLDIAIVGGGIAGVCLAFGLLKHGIPVTIYEAAHSFHEIGGGVSIGPNARRAFDLLGPGVLESVKTLFTGNHDPEEHDTYFNFRLGVPASGHTDAELVSKLKCEAGQSALHRAHLLDELVKLIPSDITHFGKRLIHLEDLGSSKGLRLLFRDGSEATHAAVIGCDGIKSVVRKHVVGYDSSAAHAHFSHKYVHRGVIPMDKAIEAVGEKLATNSNVYMGEHGYVNTLPINHGKSLNVGLFHSTPDWPHDDWVIPACSFARSVHDDYAHFGPTVQSLIPLMENTDIWALFDTVDHPAPTYFKGRLCLMGDAAHASTPSQGSGAAMAIEDAYVLSSLIAHALRARIDITAAFRAYDMVRRPRTQLLVETSREAGRVWSFERHEIGSDLEKVAREVQTRWGWIWEEDLRAEVEEGRRFVEALL